MTIGVWPWLAVAAAGALHGTNPAMGWAFARWSGRPGGRMNALLPIAIGHAASVIVVAAAVPSALQLGVSFDPLLPQGLAAALLMMVAARHLHARAHGVARAPAARTGLALWSFIVGTAHGTGWMLVPALVPLCASDMPGRQITASWSAVLALAAVGVHMAAMLATTAAMAAGAQRAFRAACEYLKVRRRAG